MQTSLSPSVCRAFLGCQIEKAVDELNLTKKIISCRPSSLPLPDHVRQAGSVHAAKGCSWHLRSDPYHRIPWQGPDAPEQLRVRVSDHKRGTASNPCLLRSEE